MTNDVDLVRFVLEVARWEGDETYRCFALDVLGLDPVDARLFIKWLYLNGVLVVDEGSAPQMKLLLKRAGAWAAKAGVEPFFAVRRYLP